MREHMVAAYQRGWALIPLKEDSKEPNLPVGHPYLTRHATSAEYKKFKFKNYGIVTGEVSGICVLDIDGPKGMRSLAQIDHMDVLDIETPQVITPNGRHIYFKHHLGISSKVGLYDGIDTRGNGGYVVGPGSKVAGAYYVWDDVFGFDNELADAPNWLLGEPSRKDRMESWRIGDMIGDGKRNSTLISLAGTLVVRDLPGPVVYEMLLVANAMLCKPPLEHTEVLKIAESAERYRVEGDDDVSAWDQTPTNYG